MSKVGIKNGDIFQIPLPADLGFAYAKHINLLQINSQAQYPTLIKIYNHRSLVSEKSVEKFINKELILSPLLIAGVLQVISEKTWKVIGNVPIDDGDKIIPHYKRPEPSEENSREWYYLIDADISKKIKSSYEKVKHLETIGAVGSELVGTKIAMALLQDEGKRIEDHFDLKEYFEKVFFKDVTSIPAYYKLPVHMKGKALP